MQIRRCYHVKVNGEQCGSPALRGKCYCYFHYRYHDLGAYGVKPRGQCNAGAALFPVLEDGNSIQAAVMQVIRLIRPRRSTTRKPDSCSMPCRSPAATRTTPTWRPGMTRW